MTSLNFITQYFGQKVIDREKLVFVENYYDDVKIRNTEQYGETFAHRYSENNFARSPGKHLRKSTCSMCDLFVTISH